MDVTRYYNDQRTKNINRNISWVESGNLRVSRIFGPDFYYPKLFIDVAYYLA